MVAESEGGKGARTGAVVAIIVAALGALGVVLAAYFTSHPGTPAPGPSTPPTAPKPPAASITEPAPEFEVSENAGVALKGTFDQSQINQRVLWLFDYDPDGTYSIDDRAHIDSSTNWSFNDRPIGDPGTKFPYKQTIVLVIADGKCDSALEKRNQGSGNPFDSLPTGCQVADRREFMIVRHE